VSIWIDDASDNEKWNNVLYIGQTTIDDAYVTGLFIDAEDNKVQIWNFINGEKILTHAVDLVMETWIPIKIKLIKKFLT
jgi:hypothetical protein